MKNHLDIYDVTEPQEQDELGENCEKKIIFVFIFSFFFKILAINVTESLGLCP